MASCDDDFSLLNDDHHHQHHHQSTTNHHHVPTPHHIHQSYTSHRFTPRSSSVHAPPQPSPNQPAQPILAPSGSPKKIGVPIDEEEEEEDTEDYGDPAFCSSSFDNGDPNRLGVGVDVRVEKRKDQSDELAEEGGSYTSYKRAKPSSSGGEYRKDREEWSDAAISCLLDAYTEKFTQLNRGNLRGRDWEEVAATVSERCEKQSKSVEQCKNKVDNLKKRYKLERHRMSNGGVSISHWPWFKQMEQIVGNSLTMKVVSDEDRSVASSGNTPRISKRFYSFLFLSSPYLPFQNYYCKNTTPFRINGCSFRSVLFVFFDYLSSYCLLAL